MNDFETLVHRALYQHKPREFCKDCPGVTIVTRKALRKRWARNGPVTGQ